MKIYKIPGSLKRIYSRAWQLEEEGRFREYKRSSNRVWEENKYRSKKIRKDRISREKELQKKKVIREVYSKDFVNRMIESLEKNIQES